MTRSTEHERIALLRDLFAGETDDGVRLGIGDDAAVLAAGSHDLVWSIDAAVEGTHFRRDLMSLEDVGWRATMAALSDLAAMGATAAGVLSSLILPPSFDDEELLELARGQREAAAACGTRVVGGNLARGDAISITTTVLGRAVRPLTRSGARPGDDLVLVGDLGWSAAGLKILTSGASNTDARVVAAFRRPRARIDDGVAAALAGATAAIDVSDGLAADLGHLARASGVTVVLEQAALHDGALEAVASALGTSALDLVLGGGEDYALVVALPAGTVLAGARRVGSCHAGSGEVVLREVSGSSRALGAKGFDHFNRG